MKFLINPNKFNQLTDIIIKPVFYLSMVTLAVGLIFALFLSPNDYQQGLTVRIMYVHVPSAWLALLTFAIMTIYSIIALAFKIPFGFIINSAVAPVGALFTLTMPCYWIIVGQTYVGNMVGLGCKINIGSYIIYNVFNYNYYKLFL